MTKKNPLADIPIPLLSTALKKMPTKYAYCSVCRQVYQDDIIVPASIPCPNNCGSYVRRGLVESSLIELGLAVKPEPKRKG